MGAFARGDVVLVPFPFSTMAGEKKRPALILADVPYGAYTDYILCAMSTQGSDDHHAVDVAPADVTNGALRQASVIRPTYVVSSSETRIIRKVGVMSADKVQLAIETLRAVL